MLTGNPTGRPTLATEQGRTCAFCGAFKPHSEFYSLKTGSFGTGGPCRPCNAQKARDLAERRRKEYGIPPLGPRKPPAQVAPEQTSNWPTGRRKCAHCRIEKDLSEFGRSEHGHLGRKATCNVCRRVAHRKAKYGITDDEYIRMLEAQGGVCAICGKPEKKQQWGHAIALSVDHNHTTGKVRDLLCHHCNSWIAPLEQAEWLAKAEAYLLRHS